MLLKNISCNSVFTLFASRYAPEEDRNDKNDECEVMKNIGKVKYRNMTDPKRPERYVEKRKRCVAYVIWRRN